MKRTERKPVPAVDVAGMPSSKDAPYALDAVRGGPLRDTRPQPGSPDTGTPVEASTWSSRTISLTSSLPYSPYNSPAGTSAFGSQPPRSYTATFGYHCAKSYVRPRRPCRRVTVDGRASHAKSIRTESRGARGRGSRKCTTVLSGAPG